MLNLSGNYVLKLNFGPNDIGIDPQNVKEFTIVQDLHKFLPEFHIKLMDSQGELTHTTPFGKSMSQVGVQIQPDLDSDVVNTFDFQVYRRMPEGLFGSSTIYDIRGLLRVDNLFAPCQSRAFISPAAALRAIASDLGIVDVNLSANLEYPLTIVQPNLSNAQFLDWLERELVGQDGEGAYSIFVSVRSGKPVLNCLTQTDLNLGPLRTRLVVNDNQVQIKELVTGQVQTYLPVLRYSVEDNYMALGAFGMKQQRSEYFDYDLAQWVTKTYAATDYTGMTDFFLIDGSDTSASESLQNNGRSGDLTGDFSGRIKSSFYSRLSQLSKLWVLTWGLPNACAGDVVKVLFAQGQSSGELQSYAYGGFWLVERVVHSLTNVHRTKLLLSREGCDTDKGSTLVPTIKKRVR